MKKLSLNRTTAIELKTLRKHKSPAIRGFARIVAAAGSSSATVRGVCLNWLEVSALARDQAVIQSLESALAEEKESV